ncbi:MAG: hypothetical protein OXP73_08225 [Chloroflexota bacterium]|nr:hypothetical protein [Chloroflexota bacterium]
MPHAVLVQLPLVACGVLGMVNLLGRMRAGHRAPAQWLALAGFSAWSLRAGIEAGWPWLAHLGLSTDFRHLAGGWLRVTCVLAVALVVTTFGIRVSWRPAFVVGAVGAGMLVWWLPGHGAALARRSPTAWTEWCGLGLYLGYFAAVWFVLLEVGRTRYRVGLPLPKQVQLRFLQAMAAAALTHVGAQGLVVVGVQAGWPGFTFAAALPVLAVLLLAFALLFWLALAPPDIWLRAVAHIEATEVQAFATTFALQTKEDAGVGRDLGWRSTLIALSEQMAREQGFGFDEVAHLRLAAALLHTEFEIRTLREPEDAFGSRPTPGVTFAERQRVHSLVARTVWVPTNVLRVLREAGRVTPNCRSARVLRVIDRYLRLTQSGDVRRASDAGTAWALSTLDEEFPGWAEVDALRQVVARQGGRHRH